jgi:hypothetical protein
MTNPFEIYKEIKLSTPFKLQDLELATLIPNSNTWGEVEECKAAILTVIKNNNILVDPILFSNVCVGLFGTIVDFEELEIPEIETINATLDFIMYVSKDNNIAYTQMSEDLKSYIAVCCLEEGLFFLENHLRVIQETANNIAKISYNNINLSDLDACKKLWAETKNSNLDTPKGETIIEHQVLFNKVIKFYTEFLKHVPTETSEVQKPEMQGK